mmetsp:Transcript_24520/g.44453  ORF Transcript_24520/g.44453 Transcript_24520/m.44453 type:complete len:253 (+) Transcript_24520:177-935(+)
MGRCRLWAHVLTHTPKQMSGDWGGLLGSGGELSADIDSLAKLAPVPGPQLDVGPGEHFGSWAAPKRRSPCRNACELVFWGRGNRIVGPPLCPGAPPPGALEIRLGVASMLGWAAKGFPSTRGEGSSPCAGKDRAEDALHVNPCPAIRDPVRRFVVHWTNTRSNTHSTATHIYRIFRLDPHEVLRRLLTAWSIRSGVQGRDGRRGPGSCREGQSGRAGSFWWACSVPFPVPVWPIGSAWMLSVCPGLPCLGPQ